MKSILISCGARLAPFDIAELREIMSDDELELDTLGDRKTALFLIMSDTDTTFNFVIAMLQSQLFNLLCDKADDVYGGRLPVHVRCLLDEFANIGQIPNFDKLIATIRSREISASIILQSQSQLKTIYKDAADTIVGNCDTTLFLGGKEKSTLKEISELLGKETIDSFNQSENRGSQVSHGLNYQKLGKELMTQDEIAVMDGGKCILQLRGVRPFFSDKFDITKHPRYYLCSGYRKSRDVCGQTHSIRTVILEELVLQNLREIVSFASQRKDDFVKMVMDADMRQRNRGLSKRQKTLVDAEKRIAELDTIFKRLYEDTISGKLSDERFQKLSTDYEKEQHQLQDVAIALRDEIETEERKSANVERFLSVVERYTEIPELTPCILHEFVEKIVVHAASDPKGKNRTQEIDIYYKGIGALEISKVTSSRQE